MLGVIAIFAVYIPEPVMCIFLLQELVQGIMFSKGVGVTVGDKVGVLVGVGVLVDVGVLVGVGVGTGSNKNTVLVITDTENGVVLKASPSKTAILIASTSACINVA